MPICPLCGVDSPAFVPLSPAYRNDIARHGGIPLERFETLNLECYSCPSCDASDRDRLMGLYFLRHVVEEGTSGGMRVLEIAPSPPLSALLREFAAEYRSGDLMSPLAMDKVDITDMRGYPDHRFDLVFCSHVLEHVVDDAAALREIRRVLAPRGRAILLVPIPLDTTRTDELRADDALPDSAERVRRFGQDDHVRMYAKADFMARIQAAGLELQLVGQEQFPDDDLAAFGLQQRCCLYVAQRRA